MKSIFHFSLLLVSLFAVVYVVSETAIPIFEDTRLQFKKLESAENISFLNLGSSHAASLGAQTLHPGSETLQYGFADLPELDAFHARLVENGVKIDTLAIGISPFHYLLDKGRLGDDELVQFRMRASWMLRGTVVFDGGYDEWIKSWFLPVSRPDRWKPLFYDRFMVKIPGLITKNPVPTETGISLERLEKHATDRAFNANVRAEKMRTNVPDISEKMETRLSELIGRAKAQGTVVFLYTPPYYHAFLNQLNESELYDFYQRTVDVSLSTRTPWLEASRDTAFTLNPAFFVDSDHLTPEASAKFALSCREWMKRRM